MLESDSDDSIAAEVPALNAASIDLTVTSGANGFSGLDAANGAPLPVVSPMLQAEAPSNRGSWLEQRHPDTDAGTSSIDYESWLNEVYAVHKPDNIGQGVATILDKFRGREDELVAFICDKYSIGPPGPEFGGSSAAAGAADAEAQGSADADDSVEPDYCELIREVYKEVNPDKIGDVPTLLAKYAGKERALYMAICEKYKVEPHQAAVEAASGADTVSSSPRDANDAASEKQSPEAPEVSGTAASAAPTATAAPASAAAEPARPVGRLPLVRFGLIPQRFRRTPAKDPAEDCKTQQNEDGDSGQQQQQQQQQQEQDKKLREEALAEVLRAQKERDEAFEGLTEVQEILGEANWRLALVSDESCAAQQEVARLEAVLAESRSTEEWHERHAEEAKIADVYKKAANDHQEESVQLELRLEHLEQLSNVEEGDASVQEQVIEQQRLLQQESLELACQVEQLKAANSDLVQRREQETQKTDQEIETLRNELQQACRLAQEQKAEILRAEADRDAEKQPDIDMDAVRQEVASEAREQISRLQQEAKEQHSQAQQVEERVAHERDTELGRVAQLQAELMELRQRAEEHRLQTEKGEAQGVEDARRAVNEAECAQQLNAKLAHELDEMKGLELQEQQRAAQMAEEASIAREEVEHLRKQCQEEASQAASAASQIVGEQHATAEREAVAERLSQQLHLAAEATEEEKRKVEQLCEEQHVAAEQAERLSQQLHLAAEATEEEKRKVEQLREEQHVAAEQAEMLRQQLHLAAEATEEEKRRVEQLREEQHVVSEQGLVIERLNQQLHLAAEATEEEKKTVEQLHDEVAALRAECTSARNGELALRAELQEQLKMPNSALEAAMGEELSSNGSGAEQ